MNIDVFHREDTPEGKAVPSPSSTSNVVRVDAFQEADDGQQYKIMLLDADDSFDIIVCYPNDQRECVWSLVRERQR
jgi:hypothetical protein